MSMGDNKLRVPKVELEATLALSKQPPRSVTIFVSGHGLRSNARELVLDLLNQSERFLPAHDSATEEWILFNKASLLWVGLDETALSLDPETEELELFDRRSAVKATFEDGTTLKGEMLFSPPATGGRVLDHLNRAEPFFALYQAKRTYLVNKKTLVTISENRQQRESRQSGGED